MDAIFFVKGFIVGLLIAAPVGPIALLCIRRTLTEGRIQGLVSGFGAAAADTLYGFITAFSLTFVSDFFVEHRMWLRIIGGIFLCALGVKTFFSNADKRPVSLKSSSLAGNFGSTFLLTLMNPMTIFAFTAVFAGLGVIHSSRNLEGSLIVGVFAGSAMWWFLLSSIAGIFREKISSNNLLWLNRISGIMVTVFGLFVFFYLKK